jgi:hypothetical protein
MEPLCVRWSSCAAYSFPSNDFRATSSSLHCGRCVGPNYTPLDAQAIFLFFSPHCSESLTKAPQRMRNGRWALLISVLCIGARAQVTLAPPPTLTPLPTPAEYAVNSTFTLAADANLIGRVQTDAIWAVIVTLAFMTIAALERCLPGTTVRSGADVAEGRASRRNLHHRIDESALDSAILDTPPAGQPAPAGRGRNEDVSLFVEDDDVLGPPPPRPAATAKKPPQPQVVSLPQHHARPVTIADEDIL